MSDKGKEQNSTRSPGEVPNGPKRFSRRKLLIGAGALVALAKFGTGLNTAIRNETSPASPSNPEPPKQTQTQESPPIQENREQLRKRKLNQLLIIPLGDSRRKTFENEYALWATDLKDIDLGLYALVDPNARIMLLEKRYALRTPENPKHKTLTEKQYEWAAKENIHPETLAMAIEGREIASRILKEVLKNKGIGKFREDLSERISKGEIGKDVMEKLQVNPDLMLISPGGLARLVITESGFGLPKEKGLWGKITGKDWIMYGFANIGSKPAVEMTIETQAHPKQPNDAAISFLVDILKNHTGLNFIPGNIPGSEKDKNSSTGGALGIQIMPKRARELYENLNKYFQQGDPLPHPLDPIGSIVLAYLFIAQGVVVTKEGYHNGYVRSLHDVKGRDITGAINTGAVNTWNNDPNQTYAILQSDESYIRKSL